MCQWLFLQSNYADYSILFYSLFSFTLCVYVSVCLLLHILRLKRQGKCKKVNNVPLKWKEDENDSYFTYYGNDFVHQLMI